jgi:hypothetical protein
MSMRSKNIFLAVLICSLVVNFGIEGQTERSINPSLASQYFKDAKTDASQHDLWKQPLYVQCCLSIPTRDS